MKAPVLSMTNFKIFIRIQSGLQDNAQAKAIVRSVINFETR